VDPVSSRRVLNSRRIPSVFNHWSTTPLRPGINLLPCLLVQGGPRPVTPPPVLFSGVLTIPSAFKIRAPHFSGQIVGQLFPAEFLLPSPVGIHSFSHRFLFSNSGAFAPQNWGLLANFPLLFLRLCRRVQCLSTCFFFYLWHVFF